MPSIRRETHLEECLAGIARLLEEHRLLETLAQRDEGPRRDLVGNLQHRQNLAELHRRLGTMHAADIAYTLEAVPLGERRAIWEEVSPELAGDVFVEVSAAVRESLVEMTPRGRLIEVLTTLDPEDLGYVSDSLPDDVVGEVSRALESADRSVFEDSIQYAERCIGHYMTREWVAVPESHTIAQTLAHIRSLGELPAQTNRIFVVDARNVFRGAVPLRALLVRDAWMSTAAAIDENETISFDPLEEAGTAVKAFERLHAAGRDPAHGSSVLLTFVTDAMGFFLFLGLASLFLV